MDTVDETKMQQIWRVLRCVVLAGLATIVAGTVLVGGSTAQAISGFGALDTAFGGQGYVTTALDSGGRSIDRGHAVTVGPDGKIVVVGRSGDSNYDTMVVLRYFADGSLDPTFGTGGKKLIAFAEHAGSAHYSANAVVIDSQGRIVIAGTSSPVHSLENADARWAIARLTSTGAVDATFGGGDGRVVTDVGDGGEALGLTLDGSDRPIVTGYGTTAGSTLARISRYTTAGVLDATFGGGDGIVTLSQYDQTVGYDVDVLSNGKIVMVGYSVLNNFGSFVLISRVSGAGVVDNAFGGSGGDNAGNTSINLGTGSYATAVSAPAGNPYSAVNGFYVLCGSYAGGPGVPRIAAINNSGDLIQGYGNNGLGDLYVPDSTANDFVVATNGTATVATTTQNNHQAVARVLPNGSADRSFENGFGYFSGPGTSSGEGIAIGSTGTVYTVGLQHVVTDDVLVTARYGSAQPAPSAPVFTGMTRNPNSVTVQFQPGGGGETTSFDAVVHSVDANGNPTGAPVGMHLGAGARSVDVPNGNQSGSGFHLTLVANGRFDSASAATVLRQQKVSRNNQRCRPVRLQRVEWVGASAKLHFAKRNKNCGTWKAFGLGGKQRLRKNMQNVTTAPIPTNLAWKIRFKTGKVKWDYLLRRA